MARCKDLQVMARPIRFLRFFGWFVLVSGAIVTVVGLTAGAYTGLVGAFLLAYGMLMIAGMAVIAFTLASTQEELAALRRRLSLGE
jgi:hypothetical protein